MPCFFLAGFIFLCYIEYYTEAVSDESHETLKLRKIFSNHKHLNRHPGNNTIHASPPPWQEAGTQAGTEAAVLFIVVIVVLSVIGMVIYFIRKFDQLNRSLPTYRYSSLKTEVNEKFESQCLVSVSTEEEDDEEDDPDEDDTGPPILPITMMPTDSDDELLQ